MIVEALAKEISQRALTRNDAIKWVSENFGISPNTARPYYPAAMRYLRPDNPEEYRAELIDRNFAILEEMLKKALERNDLKNANSIINTLNRMVGIGGNKVEIKDETPSGQTKTITISFA